MTVDQAPESKLQQSHSDTPPWAAGTEARHHELAPMLSEEEIDIVRDYGSERAFADGEFLWNVGDRDAGFFLVLDGELEIVSGAGSAEQVIISHDRGHYAGEIATMTGGGVRVAGRAKGPTQTIAVSRPELQRLIATEAELGEKILLSFILRRMRLVADRLGDVKLIGLQSDAATSRLRTFLSRNHVPHDVVAVATVAEAKAHAANCGAAVQQFPVVISNTRAFQNPSIRDLAEGLGLASQIEGGIEYDLAVVGAGPAGLAAAVYGASEGLSVLVLESCAPGGQAGSSSRIENYPGFPTGITGQALTGRVYLQAIKFGASIAVAREVRKLVCGTPFHTLQLDGDQYVRARTVILANGATYGRLPIDGLGEFEGRGVHYAASHIEGQVCSGKNVMIIGGGNSAGQAAVFLSSNANSVRVLIRGESLKTSMSEYLIRRIEKNQRITVMPRTEVLAIEGAKQVEQVKVRNNQTGASHNLPADHLFVFVGARPATGFADAALCLDEKGFIKTGNTLNTEELTTADWPLERRPMMLETSCPRIFAAGDVRAGSVKRVASAVGEGSICLQFVHAALQELEGDT